MPPRSQKLSDADRRKLRHLLRKAGAPHLIAQIPQAALRRGGRRENPADKLMLAGLELMLRTAMRERQMKRSDALRWIAKACCIPEIASSPEQLARRLTRKLRESGLDKQAIDTLVPIGIDPDKLTLG